MRFTSTYLLLSVLPLLTLAQPIQVVPGPLLNARSCSTGNAEYRDRFYARGSDPCASSTSDNTGSQNEGTGDEKIPPARAY